MGEKSKKSMKFYLVKYYAIKSKNFISKYNISNLKNKSITKDMSFS